MDAEHTLISNIALIRNEIYEMLDSDGVRIVKTGNIFACFCGNCLATMRHLQYHVQKHPISMQMQMSHIFNARMKENARVMLCDMADSVVHCAYLLEILQEHWKVSDHLERLDILISQYKQISEFDPWFAKKRLIQIMIVNEINPKQIKQHIQLHQEISEKFAVKQ